MPYGAPPPGSSSSNQPITAGSSQVGALLPNSWDPLYKSIQNIRAESDALERYITDAANKAKQTFGNNRLGNFYSRTNYNKK